ncbi:hypothetical protein FACS1894125_5680 [Actinomycetota bacterium]|nr:hypothetical protein FACS1894125_5680 [Actinomycetota bacterium]
MKSTHKDEKKVKPEGTAKESVYADILADKKPNVVGKVMNRAVRVLLFVLLGFGLVFGAGVVQSQNTNTSFAGYSEFIILTGSMTPEYPIGTLVIGQDVGNPNDLKVGDVITFTQKDGRSVTHRIVQITQNYQGSGQLGFKTKGDANPQPDPQVTIASNVRAKAVYQIPELGSIFQYVSGHWPVVVAIYVLLLIVLMFLGKAKEDDENLDLEKKTALMRLKALGGGTIPAIATATPVAPVVARSVTSAAAAPLEAAAATQASVVTASGAPVGGAIVDGVGTVAAGAAGVGALASTGTVAGAATAPPVTPSVPVSPPAPGSVEEILANLGIPATHADATSPLPAQPSEAETVSLPVAGYAGITDSYGAPAHASCPHCHNPLEVVVR